MISPSKRRGRELPADVTFRLHLVTARRLAGYERVRRAAFGALSAAVVVGLIKLSWPVGLAVHLGATLLGAIGAALIPVAPQTRRALDQIARATGLAYESALAVIDSRRVQASTEAASDPPDVYGLEASVIGRAKRSVADYKPEQGPPWWLPVTVAALAVVFLSQLLPTATGTRVAAGAEQMNPASQNETALPQPLDELVPALPASSRADAPDVPDGIAGAADSRDALPPGGSEAGNDALSRFLEALKQGQSASEPGAGQGGGNPRGSSEQQAARDARMPQPATPGGTADAADATATAEPAAEGAGQAQSEAGQAATDATNQAGEQSGQDGGQTQAESGSGQQAAGGSRTQGEQGRGDRGVTEGDEVAAGPGAGDQPGAGAGDEGTAGLGGGENGPEGTAGAGGAELADKGAQPDALFSAAGAQLLPGVILDGPTTAAGNVRLPGDDQVELPPGTAFAPYGTAVEEALGEGDLPAGYQEIIRRYFR